MKFYLYVGFFTLFSGFSTTTQAENLINIVEYKIPARDLITFSSTEVQARLCSDCGITKLKLSSPDVLFEQRTPISLQRATELYARRDYDGLSVFVNRQQSTIEMLRFGQVSEVDSYPSASPAVPLN